MWNDVNLAIISLIADFLSKWRRSIKYNRITMSSTEFWSVILSIDLNIQAQS